MANLAPEVSRAKVESGWWPRFADAEAETRFQRERQLDGLTRARVMMVAGALVVAGLGMVDVWLSVQQSPDYVRLSLQVRFAVVAPVWMLAFVSTYLVGHEQRAATVYATATVAICWALALLKWSLQVHLPHISLPTAVAVDVTAALVISIISLPLRFGHLLVTLGLVAGGISGFFWMTMPPPLIGVAHNLTSMLGGLAVLLLLVMGYRERSERRVFAQREQVQRLNADLARLNAEKNEFIAIAAHDLRAPLATVRGLAESLRDGRMEELAQQEAAHRALVEMSDRMLGLVDDYLGAHVAEHGELPQRRELVDLGALAVRVGRRFEVDAVGKAQRIEVDAVPGDATVSADVGLLDQVVSNFVGNALKFSPAGATVRLAVMVAKSGQRARLVVTDEGPGVPPAEQEHLFRKFGRTSARPTGGEKSHGLGLAVTKRLAESMGGSVGCESPVEQGRGAAFWVELPME